MREYDLIADWYSGESRGRTHGVREVLDAVGALPRGARVLDLGCGNGVPITAALLDAGFAVVGLDSSAAMLARFHTNLAATPVVRGDVRHAPFRDATFDGAVSWGMMFHLTIPDQAAALASVSRLLKPGAPFLFTGAEIEGLADDDAGITGTMNGVTFRYWAVPSFSVLLARVGMELLDFFEDAGKNGYFVARRMLASE
jgi:SAM-dependent methyltransferase